MPSRDKDSTVSYGGHGDTYPSTVAEKGQCGRLRSLSSGARKIGGLGAHSPAMVQVFSAGSVLSRGSQERKAKTWKGGLRQL